AREMAALITGPCWLVPIPDSTGNTDANAKLAHMIARYCPEAQIAKAIQRTRPVQSQCTRHKLALGPIAPEQHHFARTRKMLTLPPALLRRQRPHQRQPPGSRPPRTWIRRRPGLRRRRPPPRPIPSQPLLIALLTFLLGYCRIGYSFKSDLKSSISDLPFLRLV